MKKLHYKSEIIALAIIALFYGCDSLLFWQGEEKVIIQMDTESIIVPMKGLYIYDFKGKDAVLLSEIVEKSSLTRNPEEYFYNFIASDNYSLKALLINEKRDTGLPPWKDMKKGYLYESESYKLMVGWEEDTVGGQYGGCYKVKYMDGGTIEILEDDIEIN